MKTALVCVGLIVVLGLGGFFGYWYWTGNQPLLRDHLSRGKAFYEQQKYPEAVIELMNAARTNATSRDARYLLAKTYLAQGDIPRAARELGRLLETAPKDIEAKLLLGNLYLVAGNSDAEWYRRAVTLADEVLAAQAANAEALILAGNASAALKEYDAAIDRYKRATELEPANVAALIGQAAVHGMKQETREAERLLLEARKIDPKNKSALELLANHYWLSGDTAKAEATFEEMAVGNPSDPDVYGKLAAFYGRTGNFAGVERTLKRAQAQNPATPAPSLMLANLYLAKDRRSDAGTLLSELKQKYPESLDVACELARYSLEDQPELARKEIDQILKRDPKSLIGKILLAEAEYFAGRYDEAENILSEPAVEGSPYPEAQMFHGRIAGGQGRLADAERYYRKALVQNAQYLPARQALAEVLFSRGMAEESRKEVKQILGTQPGYVPGRLLQVALDIFEKNFPEAERSLAVLMKEAPGNPFVLQRMGLFNAARGRLSDAERNLTQAADLRPESWELFEGLIQFYITRGELDRATERIQRIPDSRKRAAHFDLLGQVQIAAKKWVEADASLRKALELDRTSVRAGVRLARLRLQANKAEEALQVLDDLSRGARTSVKVVELKGLIYEHIGKADEARKNYREALKLDPNSAVAANNLAYSLAEDGQDLATALGWAQNARKMSPESPTSADTLGWVQYKLGNYVPARSNIRFAVSKQPDNPLFLYHLAMIYRETNDLPEASRTLKKALGSRKEFKAKALAEAALAEIEKSGRS